MATLTPGIDYTARDYQSIRDALLVFGRQKIPNWKAENEGDFGVVIAEMMAYLGDVLTYTSERLSDESYLSTARHRSSILEMARMLGYVPHGYQAASGSITIKNNSTTETIAVPAWTGVTAGYSITSDSFETYETLTAISIPPETTASVSIVHGRTVQDQLGISNGTANQLITLPDFPIVEPVGSLDPGAFLRVYTIAEDPSGFIEVVFKRVDTILMATSTEMAFSTVVDAKGGITLVFGDGINGAVPPASLPIFAVYRIGGGRIGNKPANALAKANGGGFVTASDYPTLEITSSTAIEGGEDQESLESIRINAPKVWQTQNRAVALKDFETLALQVPGVIKAKAFGLNYSNVTLYVATSSASVSETQNSSLVPAPQVVNLLDQFIAPRTMVGTTLTISGFSFAEVYVGQSWDSAVQNQPMTVYKKPEFNAEDIEARVGAALSELFSFENVEFGMMMPVSKILYKVMQVNGVLFATLTQVTWKNAIPVDDPSIIGIAESVRGPTSGANDIRVRYDQIPKLSGYSLTVVDGY